jgi:hypothetical protein
VCDNHDGRCIRHADHSPDDDLLPFPYLSGEASETTLPDGTARVVTAHFEPDQTRYGSH